MALPSAYTLNDLQPRDGSAVMQALVDRYRCPEEFVDFELVGPLSADSGYFRFGDSAICYGRTSIGYRTASSDAALYNVFENLKTDASKLGLPFNPTEVIDNLRLERYTRHVKPSDWNWRQRFLRDSYYFLRPYLGAGVRNYMKRLNAHGWRRIAFPHWPVDSSVEHLSEALLVAVMKARGVERVPFVWFWPRGATASVIMTHDVEDLAGYDFCRELMDIDEAHGIKASLQLVPEERYEVTRDLLCEIRHRGFEINVQDLNHDGYLYADRQEFLDRAARINNYGQVYGAKGFRAGVLYRNPDWYDRLDFSYDMSVPNVAHLDPQRGGCCTVTPYFVGNLLEIPLTTIQDYMLFHLLGDYSLDLWKAQTEIILQRNGLISFLIHPDYVIESRARTVYCELLRWLQDLIGRKSLWAALPGEVDAWWRARSEMCVVESCGEWKIEGPGADRAVLAFAKIADDHLEYEVGASLQIIHGRPKAHLECLTR